MCVARRRGLERARGCRGRVCGKFLKPGAETADGGRRGSLYSVGGIWCGHGGCDHTDQGVADGGESGRVMVEENGEWTLLAAMDTVDIGLAPLSP